MRIPVYSADLEQDRFTKISRKLMKAWPNKISLMQAQSVVAKVFGYRDLHDLQECVPGMHAGVPGVFSRVQMRQSIAWCLWRTYFLMPDQSWSIAEGLPIEQLEIDAATVERQIENASADGTARPIYLDEFGTLLEVRWHSQTPLFIDCGAPAYKFAVRSNESVFRFSALENIYDNLPADFLTDLVTEKRYDRIKHDGELALRSFVTGELIPSASGPILSAVRQWDVMPNGVDIAGVYDRKGECVGRALVNDAIGGVYPLLFSVNGNDIFEAIADILTGKGIGPDGGVAPAAGGIELYFERYARSSNTKGFVSASVEPSRLVRLASPIRGVLRDGKVRLAGPVFEEAAQLFIRNQAWLRPEIIPRSVQDYVRMSHELLVEASNDHSRSRDAVPIDAVQLFESVKSGIQAMFDEATQRLSSASGMGQMVDLIKAIMTPAQLNRHFMQEIEEHLPATRLSEGDLDESEQAEYARERQEELGRLEVDGAEIQMRVPALSEIDCKVLGWILIKNAGEVPFGRYRGMVAAPAAGNSAELAQFIAGFVFQASSGYANASAEFTSVAGRKGDALLTVMAQILDGEAQLAHMQRNLNSFDELLGQLHRHKSFVNRVEAWRANEAEIERIRKYENFLYVGARVPVTRPEHPMVKGFEMSRSHRVRVPAVTQILPSPQTGG